jgi:hypothetical protein
MEIFLKNDSRIMTGNAKVPIPAKPGLISLADRTYNKRAGMMLHVIITMAVPFLLREPQLLVGTVVNGVLIYAALELYPRRYLGLLCILPSASAFAAGMLFGPFTIVLPCVIPAIFTGNALLIYSQIIASKSKSLAKKTCAIMGGIGLKVLVIGSFAILLVIAGIMPAMLILSFTWLQLFTAIFGTVSAIGLHKLARSKDDRSKHSSSMN